MLDVTCVMLDVTCIMLDVTCVTLDVAFLILDVACIAIPEIYLPQLRSEEMSIPNMRRS